MRMPKVAYIYGLKDPRDGLIYYVGKSDKPERRKREHLEDKTCNMARVAWIDNLQSAGLEPELTILEKSLHKEWRETEICWIARGHEQGWPLTNISKGGNGGYRVPKSPSYEFMRSYIHPDYWDTFCSLSMNEKDYICWKTAVAMTETNRCLIGLDWGSVYIDWDHVNDMLVYVGQATASCLVSKGERQRP